MSAFTKLPVSKLLMDKLMVNGVLAWIVSPFLGFVNLANGILAVDGMDPIMAGLHEPAAICSPFVIFWLGTVKQKLIKLLVDVSDATSPRK